MRLPTVSDCLRLIRFVDERLCECVIDIGAQRKTDFLMEIFPDKKHYLFEPVKHYHADLRRNYEEKNIDFEILGVALGDVDGEVFLHNTCHDRSGKITHSFIEAAPNKSVKDLVSIEPIECRQLDTQRNQLPLTKHQYLIKLDVDGVEEKIIAGGRQTISEASFLVIEASLGRRNLVSRIQLLETFGFRLFDICDPAYYFGQLSQVDLVFINESVRAAQIKFRPWEHAGGKVIWKQWQHNLGVASNFDDPFAEESAR